MCPILDDRLHQRVYPSCCKIKCQLEAEEVSLSAARKHGSVHHSVGRPERGTCHAEQCLLDPELRNILVADFHVLADAKTPPEDAEDVDDEEAVRPSFDLNVGAREDEHPGETADGSCGNGHKCVDLHETSVLVLHNVQFVLTVYRRSPVPRPLTSRNSKPMTELKLL